LPTEAIKLGIVASEFNFDITYLMLQRAIEHSKFLETQVTYVYKVPGAFDMPLAVKSLLQTKDVDAVVTLGAIIEGDTQHDEIVAQHAARKIVDLAIEYGKPVAFGISGPGMTRLQGQDRIDEYAKRAVESTVKQVKKARSFKETSESNNKKFPITID